jgi:rfaE bifunctional protein nucleotidyltransferase chain/domain
MNKKILSDSKLINIKRNNKKIVLCHGVFDHFHFGHLLYFKSAKKFGDILIVSITSDDYIKKGPGRPYNDISKRVSIISELEIVDYVVISDDVTATNVIKKIKPNFYIKGPDYKNKKKDLTKNIYLEEKIVKKYGGKLIFTEDQTESSSALLNKYFINYDDEQMRVIKNIKKNFKVKNIEKIIDKFKYLNVVVIGEPIIDEYNFTKVLGLGSKSPIISARFLKKINYPGGSLAIANHLNALGCNVTIILPYPKSSDETNIYKKIKSKIKIKFFNFGDWCIPVKSRYLNNFRSQKIFEINYINDLNWTLTKISKYYSYLKKNLFNKDMLFISDFGHGMFDSKLIAELEKIKLFKALNVQTNSANLGFNYFLKYTKYGHLTLDEREFRMAMTDNSSRIENLLKSAVKRKLIKTPFSLTLGEKGGMYVSKQGSFFYSPVFFKEIIDTMGSGDAYFSISSLLTRVKCDPALIPFISNCYAGLKTRILGNDPVITKVDLIKTMNGILS